MVKFTSFLMVGLIVASVSVFANEEMPTNVGAPSAPAMPAQGSNPGTPSVNGMGGNPEMGNQATKREPARRHHKKKHRKHRRHSR